MSVKWMHKQEVEAASTLNGVNSVVEGLQNIYFSKIAPLERKYDFNKFGSSELNKGDFSANPFVLLLGQYSTGKTTFLRYLLERDFPGQNIGPEPTTDRFVALMAGDEERVIPGNALCVQADKPFTGLQKFGGGFLNKFCGSVMNSELLENFTFIDTPGVLSGEKQRIGRAYDFPQIVSWFAERSDMIILLFDAHKLDISDEFKSAIEALRGHDEKVRVVLNKSDMVNPQQLMRVYGALMWSLGKVFQTPEVCRVYIGSFWDQPYTDATLGDLFDKERSDLFRDIMALPRNSALRKINELVKRARQVRVHAIIIGYLKSQMPALFGKQAKQEELIKNLGQVFKTIAQQHSLPPGDFPPLKKFREQLALSDFTTFAKYDEKMVKSMDYILAHALPDLMKLFPEETGGKVEANMPGTWACASRKPEFDEQFYALSPVDGKLSGGAAKSILVESGLPTPTLGRIWELADIDKDGALTDEEFAIAMYLIESAVAGKKVPETLPEKLIPPSLRDSGPVTNPFA